MNDFYRFYYFIKKNPQIALDVRQFFDFEADNLTEPIIFNLIIHIENPIDSTDYYTGGDNLTYRIDMPFRIETFLFDPELTPLIKQVDANFYLNEKYAETSTVTA